MLPPPLPPCDSQHVTLTFREVGAIAASRRATQRVTVGVFGLLHSVRQVRSVARRLGGLVKRVGGVVIGHRSA